MVIKLNWTLLEIPHIRNLKPEILLILFSSLIWINANSQEDSLTLQQDTLDIAGGSFVEEGHSDTENQINLLDTIVAKTNKIIIEEDTLPVYSFSVARVGDIFPCGSRFGISLQAPGYHIFSAESAYNATFVPNSNEILWPDEGADKNNAVYKSTFNRIKRMKVGTVKGSYGKRWTISAEQFQANYSNLFDFELDGQKRLAGDYSNMFFEMLISIQQLAYENDNLKAKLSDTESRLAAIEAKLNMQDTPAINQTLINLLKISPNPSDNGMLNIEYSINENVEKAFLYIFDLNGRSLYKTPITNRGAGSVTQLFDLVSGVYFYQLVTDGNSGETEKLIIN